MAALRSPWIVVAAALFCAHSWLIRMAIQNGDGAVYGDQIERRVPRGWRPERSVIPGHEYEVWLPAAE